MTLEELANTKITTIEVEVKHLSTALKVMTGIKLSSILIASLMVACLPNMIADALTLQAIESESADLTVRYQNLADLITVMRFCGIVAAGLLLVRIVRIYRYHLPLSQLWNLPLWAAVIGYIFTGGLRALHQFVETESFLQLEILISCAGFVWFALIIIIGVVTIVRLRSAIKQLIKEELTDERNSEQ